MEENGAPIHRVINGGGIPKRNAKLNQIYANVLRKPVLVPEGDVTSLGSVIIAFLAAGDFNPSKKRRTHSARRSGPLRPNPPKPRATTASSSSSATLILHWARQTHNPRRSATSCPRLQAIRREAMAG